jgi:hypothetical protein
MPSTMAAQRGANLANICRFRSDDGCFDAFSSRPRFDSGALIGDKPAMAKKPGTNPKGEFAFFDVVYEDGSQRSNRRVPAELLGGLDGDEPARGYIIEQDREIAEKGGRPPLKIKDISRVGAKKKKDRNVEA